MSNAMDLHNIIVGLSEDVTSVAVDVWQDEDGTSNVILWDRTGHAPEDGQWGNEVFRASEWEYDFRSDAEHALTIAGFNVSCSDDEWLFYDLPEGAGLMLSVTR